VAEDRRRLDAEVAAHGLQVRNLGVEAHILGPGIPGRPAAPALVVVREPARICEPVELRPQVAVIEVRPAVEDDDRPAGADLAAVEPPTLDGDVPFAAV
jgi:hypothetical protein